MREDSLIGQQLDEYRLEALLGQGGMARVYRGLDLGLNRYVAIKVIDTPYRGDEEYVKRFKIEAQAIARLDHPNVVRLYRYGDVDGLLYMAMQFIEGTDLGFLLKSYRLDGEYIAPADALRVVSEICQSLDYIHAHGIIHRDVKPSNIMLTGKDGRAILTDFGLALRSEVGTRGQVFGSPHYIAPEQAISSARAVPQSDLYSLGVIMYEMFAGVLPFNAAASMDVAVMHMSTPPPPPSEIRPQVSPEIEAVILKALEKKPQDRYQSGQELSLALERALAKQPEPPAPTNQSFPERVTTAFAANPLPPLPPAPQQSIPSTLHVLSPEQNRSVSPGAPVIPVNSTAQAKKKLPRWALFGTAILLSLCVLACLTIGIATVILRANAKVIGNSRVTPTVSENVGKPGIPTLNNLPQATPENDLSLKVWRCDEEGCLVVANSGRQPFPMASLSLLNKDTTMSGLEWGIADLQPGQCVKVVKDENWVTRMPQDAVCTVVGHPLVREGKDRFWNNTFSVAYENKKVTDCLKKDKWCEVQIIP
jgi:serine/threonine protein kinase